MKLLEGRTVTEVVKASFTAAEVGDIADGDVLVSVAVPRNTLVLQTFVIADDLDSNGSPTLELDVGHSGYTDTDGDVVAASDDALGASLDISETGGQNVDTTILLVGDSEGTDGGGTVLRVKAEGTAATGAAGDIRIGYVGVAIPAGS